MLGVEDRAARPRTSRSSLCSLPTTIATSGISTKVCGSVWAAQPVTTIFAPTRSLASLRMLWRACRTASAVTAQVFTTMVFSMPAAVAALRITSDS